MKIKNLVIVLGAISGSAAYARCATFAYQTSCVSEGGVICADGGCYICCDPTNSPSTTACSGTYTTDTSLTFSDEIGSGYYTRRKYTKSCKCLEL